LIAHHDAYLGAQMYWQGLDQGKHLIIWKRFEDQYAQAIIVPLDYRRRIATLFEVLDGSSFVLGENAESRGFWFCHPVYVPTITSG
jgi:hypothetical protein